MQRVCHMANGMNVNAEPSGRRTTASGGPTSGTESKSQEFQAMSFVTLRVALPAANSEVTRLLC